MVKATDTSKLLPRTLTLDEGDAAPDFSLPDETGEMVTLKDLRGKTVVLYFYPKDDTPGCTTEACSFRDAAKELRAKGAVVYGMSTDPVASHQKFKAKYKLNFPLLADEDKKVVSAYGVWKQKSMYGRTYMGVERTTLIMDKQGRIAKIFPKVSVTGHIDAVLEALS